MNPETGRLEALQQRHEDQLAEVAKRLQGVHRSDLVRPDGSAVPAHWAIFTAGDLVTVKRHTFKVVYMNEFTLILEPVKPGDMSKRGAADTPAHESA